jgi:sugar/nucleoside kinase (ribokinase family)
VDQYPPSNYGAEVVSTERGVAADGPMVTLTLASMQFTVGLVANSLGRGAAGNELTQLLERSSVELITPSFSVVRSVSPQITVISAVISDRLGSRTWFPYLPNVDAELHNTELHALSRCTLVYLDYYEVIRRSADRVIATLIDISTPLFINLGGTQPGRELLSRLRRCRLVTIQTNVSEGLRNKAVALAQYFVNDASPDLALVTMGADGAVGISSSGAIYDVPVYSITPRRLHGADAVFSAGLIASLLNHVPYEDALIYASACGAYQCERHTQATWPTAHDIVDFQASHRLSNPNL